MPQKLIENVLKDALESLLKESDSLCELDGGELNYANSKCQKYYLLRYYPAYFCEYVEAFTVLFNKLRDSKKLPRKMRVLSCGCGACIDYSALMYVIERDGIDLEIEYLGIDIHNWWGRPSAPNLSFRQGCISELCEAEVCGIDVIVFPKSLTDISDNVLKKFSEILSIHLDSDRFYLVSSFITSNAQNESNIRGIDVLDKIVSSFQDMGFRPDMSPRHYWRYKEEKGIRSKHHPYFIYPDKIKGTLETLHDHCPGRSKSSPQCVFCSIGKSPILKTNYIAYNVLKLSRK